MALVSNPIKEILLILPYADTVLDAELYDTLREILLPKLKYASSDRFILSFLEYLSENNVIKLTSIRPVSATGKIYLIKRL